LPELCFGPPVLAWAEMLAEQMQKLPQLPDGWRVEED
jgi:hypothetical protein